MDGLDPKTFEKVYDDYVVEFHSAFSDPITPKMFLEHWSEMEESERAEYIKKAEEK